ncbi:hypothetical protein HPB52_023204 [Rhipicephalus sanguineus]|uniref:Uncharacterized protein n=1 Tax=Rhipicephalus sanguineus TaxID=34632 RepID=A0A9D4T508_RHISA|nr:hypothetical protein HPB52_023204 [Rhipicephalus sanguineus]
MRGPRTTLAVPEAPVATSTATSHPEVPVPAEPPVYECAACAARDQLLRATPTGLAVTPTTMATNFDLPVRENCFLFCAPEGDVTTDDLTDTVEATAGEDSVLVLQHMGGAKFLVGTHNTSQATRLMVAEAFRINNEKVAVEAVGPPVTFVNVYRCAAYILDEVLLNALAQYGKVKSITFATVASRHNKLNGVRVVKLEMNRPVPNFLTVAGHRVMCEYRGMRRVCARCRHQ